MVELRVQPSHKQFHAFSVVDLIQLIVGHVNNLVVDKRHDREELGVVS